MSLAMSEHERQEFPAGVHVGVISIERADGPPLQPLPRAEEPPFYKYVGVEGPIVDVAPTRWWSVDYTRSS
jgi:hypothetical protein